MRRVFFLEVTYDDTVRESPPYARADDEMLDTSVPTGAEFLLNQHWNGVGLTVRLLMSQVQK